MWPDEGEGAKAGGAGQGTDQQQGAKAQPPQGGTDEHPHHRRGHGRQKGERARLHRAHTQPELQHERQQINRAVHRNAAQPARQGGNAEGAFAQQAQIDRRMRPGAAVAPKQAQQRHRPQQQHSQPGDRQMVSAFQTDLHQAHRQAEQHEAPQIESWRRRGIDVADEARGQRHAQQTERQVDIENPAPRQRRGEIAAEQRPDHRPDDGGQRRIGHGANQLRARKAAQQNEASDRRHHRPAQTLQHPHGHQHGKTVGQPAQHRAGGEQPQSGHEHAAAAEAVGAPAAQWNEHRQGQHIGAHRQTHLHRADLQRPRHVGNGSGDDGGVELLHQEGDGHDDGDQRASLLSRVVRVRRRLFSGRGDLRQRGGRQKTREDQRWRCCVIVRQDTNHRCGSPTCFCSAPKSTTPRRGGVLWSAVQTRRLRPPGLLALEQFYQIVAHRGGGGDVEFVVFAVESDLVDHGLFFVQIQRDGAQGGGFKIFGDFGVARGDLLRLLLRPSRDVENHAALVVVLGQLFQRNFKQRHVFFLLPLAAKGEVYAV